MFTFCASAQKVGRTTYDMPEAGGSAYSTATAQRDLNKRRENKVKAELASKQDRVNQLRQEIAENERQLDMAQVRQCDFLKLKKRET